MFCCRCQSGSWASPLKLQCFPLQQNTSKKFWPFPCGGVKGPDVSSASINSTYLSQNKINVNNLVSSISKITRTSTASSNFSTTSTITTDSGLYSSLPLLLFVSRVDFDDKEQLGHKQDKQASRRTCCLRPVCLYTAHRVTSYKIASTLAAGCAAGLKHGLTKEVKPRVRNTLCLSLASPPKTALWKCWDASGPCPCA